MNATVNAPHCISCTTKNPATVCHACAQNHTACTHPEQAFYCTHCATVYGIVANCFSDGDEGELLTESDYEVWATDSAFGAGAEDLRPIAGWIAGWRLHSGNAWPIYEGEELYSA